MDTAGWPGWIFSGLVGVVAAILTRSAAVRAAMISSREAPYEAMAARLGRLEDERDKVEREHDADRVRWEIERKELTLKWEHERAGLVITMGTLAHENAQLRASVPRPKDDDDAAQTWQYGSE